MSSLSVGVAIMGTALAALPGLLGAQSCPVVARPYFEHQVETPAELVTDTTVSPRPYPRIAVGSAPQDVVVQFVVDTLGRPDSASFRVIFNRDDALASAGRSVVARWRYQAATIGGCKVPQVVQVPLRR